MRMSFDIIYLLCWLNFLFLLEHLLTLVFLNKIRRKYTFPNILHATDLLGSVCSQQLI